MYVYKNWVMVVVVPAEPPPVRTFTFEQAEGVDGPQQGAGPGCP